MVQMSPETNTQRFRWWYSVTMLCVYIAAFHIWKPFARGHAALFGLVVAFGLFTGALEARRRGYFVNGYDFAFHGVVILDLILEGLLVPAHSGHGFYGCAAAFAVAIGGYRIGAWRKAGRLGADEERDAVATPDIKTN